jgi:hypothetical protein
MVMFEGVVEEDREVRRAKEDGREITLPPAQPTTADSNVPRLPSASDAYLVFEDLCLLVNGDAPNFLKLQSLPRTFGLELIESVLSDFWGVFKQHEELLHLLRTLLSPLLIRALSEKPNFSTTLRLMRVVFLLLKQFNDELVMESEIFLSMFIKVVAPGDEQGSGGHPFGPGGGGSTSAGTAIMAGTSPHWMRVLALEIFRGLCGDFYLLQKVWRRYDAQGSRIFLGMISAFNRLATEKPALLGVNDALTPGIDLHSQGDYSVGGMIEGMVEMASQAASSVTGTTTSAGLNVASASMKVQWYVSLFRFFPGLGLKSMNLCSIDQLDKAEVPPIPETYAFLLALQCIASIPAGFASFSLPLYSSVIQERARSSGETLPHAPPSLDFSSLPDSLSVQDLATARDMALAGWPALLASLSFFISTNLDEELFGETLNAFQAFTNVCGVLGLDTPRDAFLTGLCKFAVPAALVANMAADAGSSHKPSSSMLGLEGLGLGTSPTPSLNLGSRNLACLRSVISVARFLAGSLGDTWFCVFEALQNADFVIRTRRRKQRPGPTAGGSPSKASPYTSAPPRTSGSPSLGNLSTTSLEAEETAIQASTDQLFEISRNLDDSAFRYFVRALCRLDGEMIGMPVAETPELEASASASGRSPSVSSDVGAGGGSETSAAPGRGGGARRRASGISVIRTVVGASLLPYRFIGVR